MKRFIRGQALVWVLLMIINLILVPITAMAADGPENGIQIAMRSTESEIASGKRFMLEIDYSLSSTTQQYTNAQIVVPLPKELKFDSAVNANDTAYSYDAASHTVTFKFNNAIKAGTTGTLQLNVYFPNFVTPNGTKANVQSRFESSQGLLMSNTVQVTATASADWEFKKERTRPITALNPKPGSEVEYKITFYNKNTSNFGRLELRNVVVQDTLPPGAQYVSSRPNASVAGNTVTWNEGTFGENIGYKEYWVTVKYPLDASGDVTNKAEATFNPLNQDKVTLKAERKDSFTNEAGNGSPGFFKMVNDRQKEISPGQLVNFNILNLYSTANVKLQNYVFTDMTPSGLELQQITTPTFNGISTYAVEYTLSNNADDPWMSWGTVRADQSVVLKTSDAPITGASVKGIRFVFGEVPVDFYQNGNLEIRYRLNPAYAAPVEPNESNKITNLAKLNYSFEGVRKEEQRTASIYVVQNRPLIEVTKKVINGSSFSPGDTVKYRISVRNTEYSSSDFNNPIIEDLLPAELEYVAGSGVVVNDSGLSLPAPKFEQSIVSANGRTLLKWLWDDGTPAVLGSDKKIELEYEAKIKAGTIASYVDNEADVTSDKHPYLNSIDFAKMKKMNGKWYVYNNGAFYVNSVVKVESVKWVQGDLDGDNWTKYPDKAITTPGGKVEYKLQVTNVGNIPVRSLLIVDALPRVGDRGVVDISARDSKWSPVLTSKLSTQSYITVNYTTDTSVTMSGGIWSKEPPADITKVTGIKLEFSDDHVIAPGAQEELRWVLRAPVNAPTDEVAWNSFGYTAKRSDNGKSLLTSEPLKVGVVVKEDAKGEIGDYVWLDNNEDGIQNEPKEQGVNGVQVELYNASDKLVQTTITSNDHGGNPGYYLFTNLDEGSYRVKFIRPDGYSGWVRAFVGDNRSLDSDANADGWSEIIRLAAGDKIHTIDAGLTPPKAKIGDKVWIDKNGDGLQDAGELGLNGVTVNLYDKNGYLLGTTVTSENGVYEFNYLTSGEYVVEFILPSGYTFTKKGDGSKREVDSDADLTGKSGLISLGPDEVNTTIDAGLLVPNSSLGNRVWLDENKNGLQDAGESGMNGVSVQLYSENGELLSKTSTVKDAVYGDGYYEFNNLWAGNYIVQFLLPGSSYEFTSQGSDAKSDTDSNANPTDGKTSLITLGFGESNPTIDAGLKRVTQPPARGSIGDTVWLDSNGDGIQNDGNTGVNGIVVKLFDDAGILQSSTVTASVYNSVYRSVYASNGFYRFDNLLAGSYAVKFELPNGYAFSAKGAGDDNTLDSDANADGMTDLISLAPGQINLTVDAGLQRATEPPIKGSVGDFVWIDDNEDGIQNDKELGLNDVTVKLYNDSGQLLKSTVTGTVYGRSGSYLFDALQPGIYKVKVDLPAGYDFTSKGAGENKAADSDVSADGFTDTFTLAAGEKNLTVDAGLRKQAVTPPKAGKIGDFVWIDSNGNGLQDAGEPGVNGLFVNLYDESGRLLTSTVTGTVYGQSGTYSFDHLQEGKYFVKFDLPSGLEFTRKGNGTDRALDSDAKGDGSTDVLTLADGQTNLTVDAGLVKVDDGGNPGTGPENPDAAIGDYVWLDTNGDGIQNNEETGMNGIIVRLYSETGIQLTSTVTGNVYDKPGYYTFGNLQPGRYVVKFDPPTGYEFTPKGKGTDSAVDSDAKGDGATDVIILAAGDRNLTIDAGLRMKSTDPGPSDPGDSGGSSPSDPSPGGGGGQPGSGGSGGQPTGNQPDNNSGGTQPGTTHGGVQPPDKQPDGNNPDGNQPGNELPSEKPTEPTKQEQGQTQPDVTPTDKKTPDQHKGGKQLPLTGESLPATPFVGLMLCIAAAFLYYRGKKAKKSN
ncbi:SdrD B-like domain-containing protein [Paenibacillus sp. UNC451MF]|uniref:SdrD B-like domain-containing protein n=1 Tax=Paenibacillus sp. UNC451MF TaxID=1449063 RepID=UPI00048C8E3F|nr:SdrD B-like domain-containing protein [Paenibacillus sp. UNC451MF]